MSAAQRSVCSLDMSVFVICAQIMCVQLCTSDVPLFMTFTISGMVINSAGLTSLPGPGSTDTTAFQKLSPKCTENHPAAVWT